MDELCRINAFNKRLGLYSNKTAHNADREGFLEYYNIENDSRGRRVVRGGSQSKKYINMLTAIGNETTFTNIQDFNWYSGEKDKAATHVDLIATTSRTLYYYDDSAATLTKYKRLVDNTERWSIIPFRNRLFVCTANPDYYYGEKGDGSSVYIYTTNGSREVTVYATAPYPPHWIYEIQKGTVININGVPYIADGEIYTSGFSKNLLLTVEYTGVTGQYGDSASAAAGTWVRYEISNRNNLLVHDPNEARYHEDGTVSVTTDSSLVTGVGFTNWNKNWAGAEFIGPDGQTYLIDSMNITTSSQKLTLTTNYQGSPTTGSYKIRPRFCHVGCYVPPSAPAISINTATSEYTTGTADVINGSTTVTGNGTTWDTSGAWDDKYFIGPDSKEYKIKSVDSATQLTLYDVYDGDSASAASYIIRKGALDVEVSYTYAYAFYNSRTGHISNYSPSTTFTTEQRGVDLYVSYTQISLDLADQFFYDTVIILRSVDGGANLYETARMKWATNYIVDQKADSSLRALPAAKYHNAVPPNVSRLEAWGGRLWGIHLFDKSKIVYSSVAQETPWGRPEECWPATNFLIVPSEAGNITEIKTAGAFLYVMTDRKLYIINGTSPLNFRLEQITEVDGGMGSDTICEYQHQDSEVGIAYITKSKRVYAIAPRMGKIELGYPIRDKTTATGSDWDIARIFRVNYGDRNYVMVTIGREDVTQIITDKTFVYDATLDTWYEFSCGHPYIYVSDTDLSSTKIIGSYLYEDQLNSDDYIHLMEMFSGSIMYDYYVDATHKTTYTAYLQTAWHDQGDKKPQKTLKKARIYATTSGFTADCYRDEQASPYISTIAYAAQTAPFQNANGKEYTAYAVDADGIDYYHHSYSVKIHFPVSAGAAIERIENEVQYDSADPSEH